MQDNRSLDELMRDARNMAEAGGHVLVAFFQRRDSGRVWATSQCAACRAQVMVTERPAPGVRAIDGVAALGECRYVLRDGELIRRDEKTAILRTLVQNIIKRAELARRDDNGDHWIAFSDTALELLKDALK